MRTAALVGTALLAGAVTAYAGPIAFLGIAAPHLARGVFRTSDHRVLIPGNILLGSVIALAAGLFVQLPGVNSDAILPLNSALALIGAPIVLRVLMQLSRKDSGFAL